MRRQNIGDSKRNKIHLYTLQQLFLVHILYYARNYTDAQGGEEFLLKRRKIYQFLP